MLCPCKQQGVGPSNQESGEDGRWSEHLTNKLMRYSRHSQNRFNNRLNFFLVFESVLLGVVGVLYSRPSPAKVLLIVLILFLAVSSVPAWHSSYGLSDKETRREKRFKNGSEKSGPPLTKVAPNDLSQWSRATQPPKRPAAERAEPVVVLVFPRSRVSAAC
jgi:hypothetical protein